MNQNKLIIALLIIILIIGGIFLFKMLNPSSGDTLTGVKNNLDVSNVLDEKNNIYDSNYNQDIKDNANNVLSQNAYNILFFIQGINIISAIFSLVFYILFSLGLMKFCEEINYPIWLAWIPIVQIFLLIDIAYRNKTTMCIAVISFIVYNFLGGLLALIAILILLYYILNALQKIYISKSHHPTLLLILSIVSFGTLVPVFIFAIRNN